MEVINSKQGGWNLIARNDRIYLFIHFVTPAGTGGNYEQTQTFDPGWALPDPALPWRRSQLSSHRFLDRKGLHHDFKRNPGSYPFWSQGGSLPAFQWLLKKTPLFSFRRSLFPMQSKKKNQMQFLRQGLQKLSGLSERGLSPASAPLMSAMVLCQDLAQVKMRNISSS